MSEENKTEQTLAEKLQEVLGKRDNAPTEEQITAFKATYGDIYIAAFDEEEIFLFRSLTRLEYRALQEQAMAGQIDAAQHEEQTVRTCLLWKSIEDLEAKAGTIPSLIEMIMQNSNFVSPQIAAQLVAKL